LLDQRLDQRLDQISILNGWPSCNSTCGNRLRPSFNIFFV